jgi:hypothetical protein
MKSLVITTLACLVFCGCNRPMEHKWQSGSYSVSVNPKSHDVVFGYKLTTKGGIEHVGNKVVAVGENDLYIVCKRDAGSRLLYYAITKSASGQGDTVSGPMNHAEFDQRKSKYHYPDFIWEQS